MKSLFLPTSWTPVVLAWSFLLLLPFGRSSELPVFIMAILGGMLIWKHGKQIVWEGGARTFSLLFLCIWIPIALSVPDSLWFKKSLSTALTYPRIYLAGIYMIWVLRDGLAQQRLLKLSAWLLMFWVFDALVQTVVGYDLLGYAYPERLNGIFGPHNWKLGLTLAMLSPMVWEYVSRHGRIWQVALAWAGTGAVVLLGSNRESWIVFAVASALWGWAFARRLGLRPVRLIAFIALVSAAAGAGVYQTNPKFAQRADQSVAALNFTYESLNAASSLRLQVWHNAAQVLANHALNGVGVRSYRYAYAEYAERGDIFVNADGTGLIYAHQLLLEVGSETGVIGLIGLATFFLIFLRVPNWDKSTGGSLRSPAWLGAWAWLFPFNTHTALYSAYWSLLIWWLIAHAVAHHSGSEFMRSTTVKNEEDL